MKIGILITSFGPIDQMIYHNHLSVLLHWKSKYDIICYHIGDVQQEESLKIMTQSALEDGCTHLLFLEHDNVYPKNMLESLIEHDLDAVSGYYTLRAWPYAPIPLLRDTTNGLLYRLEYAVGDDSPNLIEITVGCFGCCLVKAEVLKDLLRRGRVFRREYSKKANSSLTADVVFFRDLQEFGYKLYVDGNVRVGHLAQRMLVTPDNFRAVREMAQLAAPESVPLDERISEDLRKEKLDALLNVEVCNA